MRYNLKASLNYSAPDSYIPRPHLETVYERKIVFHLIENSFALSNTLLRFLGSRPCLVGIPFGGNRNKSSHEQQKSFQLPLKLKIETNKGELR